MAENGAKNNTDMLKGQFLSHISIKYGVRSISPT